MIVIDKNSLLGRWFIWCVRGKRFPWRLLDVDICTFRRVCFITGPLKYLAIATAVCFLFTLLIIRPLMINGLAGLLPLIGIVLGFFATIATMFGLFFLLSLIFNGVNKSQLVEIYKSWKEKYCTKVTFK